MLELEVRRCLVDTVQATWTRPHDNVACLPDQYQMGSFVLFLHLIHLLSLFWLKHLLLRQLAAVLDPICALSQPHFYEDDLPQLRLVAIESRGKPLQARHQTRSIHKSALH